MKTSTKTVIAAGAIALLGATALAGASQADRFGDDHHRGGGPAMFGPHAMLEAFDADGDGNLTQAEIDAARSERFARYDADGDGALSMAEFEGLFHEATRPMMVRAYQRLDPDGNAKVTSAEYERAFARMVARHDRDGDGMLSMGNWHRGHHRDWDDDRDDD